MPQLPAQSDLEIIVGASNVSQWADVDNDKDTTKRKARVAWAIARGYDYVIARISPRYDITTFVTFPSIVFQLIARRACIELYKSPRGLVDGDQAAAQLKSISIDIEAQIEQILAGQLPLIDAPSQPNNYPEVDNSGCLPWSSFRRSNQWSGDPCVETYTRFYDGVQ
jgi:hypothetical protein